MECYLWSWFGCFVLVYLAKLPGLWAQKQQGFDNAHPRLQQQTLAGLGHRAYASHQNSFEALIGLTAALSVGLWAHGPTDVLNRWAVAFFVCRVIYVGLYWANLATLRSAAWFVGMFILGRLFLAAIL